MDPRIPPEVLAQFMAQLTQEEQDADLQNQIALAQEMRFGRQGPERSGAAANAVQGVADIVRAFQGRRAEKQARGERAGLSQQRQAGRQAIGNWYTSDPQPVEQPIPEAAPALWNADPVPPLLRRPKE